MSRHTLSLLSLPFLVLFLVAGCGDSGEPVDAGGADADSGQMMCAEPAPTDCYELLTTGGCRAVDAECVNDSWRCTTVEDFATMMIACETGGLLPDAGF